MTVSAIPEGYHSITPYIIVRNAVEAIGFYNRAFNAEEIGRLAMPDGTIMHGEMKVGNSHIMFSEENQQMNMQSPLSLNGVTALLCVYVEDVDSLFNQAIAAGATELRPVQDQFWGDRAGTVQDPYGHQWTIMTRIEDVSWDEVQQRFEEMYITSDN